MPKLDQWQRKRRLLQPADTNTEISLGSALRVTQWSGAWTGLSAESQPTSDIWSRLTFVLPAAIQSYSILRRIRRWNVTDERPRISEERSAAARRRFASAGSQGGI